MDRQVRLDVFSDYDTSAAAACAERMEVANYRTTPDGASETANSNWI